MQVKLRRKRVTIYPHRQNRGMRRLSGLVASLFIFLGGFVSPAQADESSVTVLSRNIYLGADVGIAMDLLPDFKAAAQFMWEQVELTDFNQRSRVLANEIVTTQPDVIGIQEATKWMCQKGLISSRVTVYDFTQMLLVQLEQLGFEYEVATYQGKQAVNPGFSIPPIPHLTLVTDKDVFPAIFGTETVACGFEIADVLLVKSALSDKITAVGTTEYESAYTIIPTLMTVYRGFSWADIEINGTEVRFVTTHLESLWDEGEVPTAKIQAEQLVEDLLGSGIPVIAMGDFNSDPRDPRGSSQSNPGEQPVASEICDEQVVNPSSNSAYSECNAYWTMIQAGYRDAGPDSQDSLNATWGANSLLSGPDPKRLNAAVDFGNQFGFSDRLDYIFLSPELEVSRAQLVGNIWPNAKNLWECKSPEQVALSQEAVSILGLTNSSAGCFPSDHAGLVVEVKFSSSDSQAASYPDPHTRFPIGFWKGLIITLALLITIRIGRRIVTSRASKAV